MRRPRSLRVRLLAAFVAFGVALATGFGLGAWEALKTAEDHLLARWLTVETEHARRRGVGQPGVPLPSGPFAYGATDPDDLPADLQGRVEALPAGSHELHGSGNAQWKLQIAELDEGRRLYVYLDASALEVSEGLEVAASLALVALALLTALAGVGLGTLTTRRVIAPLVRLTDAVTAHDPTGAPPDLSEHRSDDEVGVLAEQLQAAMTRVAASARQEQLFGRYTSHELRSSLSVVRGVAELLGALDDPRLAGPVGRLDRASQDMGTIIETTLWLARSDGQALPVEPIELGPLVHDVVADSAGRAPPQVELAVDVDDAAVVMAPRLALKMILQNLLTNALRHTEHGRIELTANADRIAVTDTGPGIPPDVLARITAPYVRGPGGGHGLGLSIVNGLCARLGWGLEVRSELGRGTQAEVTLDP